MPGPTGHPTTSGRRTRARPRRSPRRALAGAAGLVPFLLVVGLLGGLVVVLVVGLVAGPAAGAAPFARERVTGTVLRTAAESGPGSTWLVTRGGHLRVDATALAGVPDGARVTAVLDRGDREPPAPAPGAPALRRPVPLRVVSLRVVRRPAARPAYRRAAAAPVDHDVTVALVTPPGSRRDTMTVPALEQLVNGPVAAYWREQSEGAVTLHVGRALDWYASPYRCADIWRLWEDVGRRAGYRPGPNRHLLVYLTSSGAPEDCWSGLATVGAELSSGGTMYVRAGLTSLVAHEFGHNLGLRHSQALRCDGASDGVFVRGSWPPSCRPVDYGDWYDVMGASWREVGTLSAAQALHLRVYGPDRARTVEDTTVADLRPVSAHRGLSALRVRVPGASYVLEYRPAEGQDAWLAGRPYGLGAGLLVRRDAPDREHAGETLLLDASPTAARTTSRTAPGDADADAGAAPGRPVVLDGGAVVVTVLSQGRDRARVRVAVAGRATAAAHGPGWPGSRLRVRTERTVR